MSDADNFNSLFRLVLSKDSELQLRFMTTPNISVFIVVDAANVQLGDSAVAEGSLAHSFICAHIGSPRNRMDASVCQLWEIGGEFSARVETNGSVVVDSKAETYTMAPPVKIRARLHVPAANNMNLYLVETPLLWSFRTTRRPITTSGLGWNETAACDQDACEAFKIHEPLVSVPRHALLDTRKIIAEHGCAVRCRMPRAHPPPPPFSRRPTPVARVASHRRRIAGVGARGRSPRTRKRHRRAVRPRVPLHHGPGADQRTESALALCVCRQKRRTQQMRPRTVAGVPHPFRGPQVAPRRRNLPLSSGRPAYCARNSAPRPPVVLDWRRRSRTRAGQRRRDRARTGAHRGGGGVRHETSR